MPFAPTDISGLVLWLKADAGVYKDAGSTTAANGDTVQQWNDQSGNNNHVSQATSGNRPTLVTGALNSLPVVRFSASGSKFLSRSLANTASATAFFAAKRVNNNQNQGILGFNAGSGGIDSWYLQRWSDSSGAIGVWDSTNLWKQDGAFTDNTYNVGCLRRNNTPKAIDFWKNNSPQTGATYSSNPPSTSGLWIGRGDSGAEYFNSDLAEVLLYSAALTDAEVGQVNDYLGISRYALWTSGNIRATQVVAEVVHLSTSAARTTQVVAEVVRAGVTTSTARSFVAGMIG